jgi:hypothetical protein
VGAIRKRLWQDKQSWNYEAIYELNGNKVRVNIKRDAFDFQSYARAHVLDCKQWRPITRIPYPHMHTKASYVSDTVTEENFTQDEKELIEEVSTLLQQEAQ